MLQCGYNIINEMCVCVLGCMCVECILLQYPWDEIYVMCSNHRMCLCACIIMCMC